MTQPVNGFLVVDKPSKFTSHDVVNKVRRSTGVKKIGHAGTLDPMATGVLVLCLGYATRLSEYVMASDKTYLATLRLGLETDTYDADGRPTAEADPDRLAALTRADVEAQLAQFRGNILQVPPMYSAIQKNGKRLYELARAGIEIEREPRPVTISELEIVDWYTQTVILSVTCSAGTYIRSLAHDLGQALGVGAHLTALRRTRSGTLDEPIDWQLLMKAIKDESWERYVIDEQVPLKRLLAVQIDIVRAGLFSRGQPISSSVVSAPAQFNDGEIPVPTEGEVRVYDTLERLIGIGQMHPDRLQPVKVFG
jgi:tRNA pseudouridine55 synthase